MSGDNTDGSQQEFELPIYKARDCDSKEQAPAESQVTLDMFNELQLEVLQLRAEFAKLRRQLDELQADAD